MAFHDNKNSQLIDFIDSTPNWKNIQISED